MPDETDSGSTITEPSQPTTILQQALYLYLHDGRPVTDKDGRPLLNIAGNRMITTILETSSIRYEDVKGQPLTDSNYRTPDDFGYEPSKSPSFKISKRICSTEVFALDGHPLTGTDRVPLNNINGKPLLIFNPKGHPVSDIDGRDVTDKFGNILNANEKPYLSKDKIPLRIFDHLGRPLTDENGYPLTNILNESLIIYDEFRNPIGSIDGYQVRDAEGKVRWDQGYDLTKTPKYNKINKMIICKNNEPAIAFDLRGHPLTDMNGFPLFDLDGTVLVKKRKIWMDKGRNPVQLIRKSIFDKTEMTVLKNSHGDPVRLYDKRGYPLTDHKGTPLRNALGYVLLKLNENGEPTSDNNEAFYDCKGNEFGSDQFSPCRQYEKNPALENALRIKSHGVQFFDRRGMPMTNREGIPLMNAQQKLIAEFDIQGVPIRDMRGYEVYNISGLPLIRSLDKPLIGPNGDPIRLYNKYGRPLVDKYGFTLRTLGNEHMLKLNHLYQIVSDYKNGPIFDMEGNPETFIDKFFATKYPPGENNSKILVKLDGSPLLLFNLVGEPLTDSFGHVLYDSFGSPLITCTENGNIYDHEGNEVMDLEGFNCLQVAGRCLREKMALYDEHDRPLIGYNGYVLRTRMGKELIQFDSQGFPVSAYGGKTLHDSKGISVLSSSADLSQCPIFEEIVLFDGKMSLYDCEDLPLLDITGALLMTSRGIPLLQLDEQKRPRCDCFGRPVFDRRGIPVANPGGIWKNSKGAPYRLYDENCLPLSDPRGKGLLDIENKPLIIRDFYGRPKLDRNGKIVRDANGRLFTDPKFEGTFSPPDGKSVALYDNQEKPLRLYDLEGNPLTDECGKPLETSKGKPILSTSRGLRNILDLHGRTVFDSYRLPLSCKSDAPILTMTGEPMLLYNEEGIPLTTEEGLPIRCLNGQSLLEFDEYGRPSGSGNSTLFDNRGVRVESLSCCLNSKVSKPSVSFMSLEGRPLRIFDEGGHPITDDKGNVLFQSDGTPLKAGSWGDPPIQEVVHVS